MRRADTLAVDSAFTLSPAFVEFIAYWLEPGSYDGAQWFDQTSEELGGDWPSMIDKSEACLQRLMLDARAMRIIERANVWFEKLMQGEIDTLTTLHQRCQFIAVIGIPRTGGSYMTAELFAALGYDKTAVHAAIAHDGFPDARPFRFRPDENPWVSTLASMAQYLTAIELFFGLEHPGKRVVVPKKATKAVYASGLFRAVFGRQAQYVITVRHPVASCISTYEKSGGMPAGGTFRPRSIIEQWIMRDNLMMGVSRAELFALDYFEAYVRYWEQFHIRLALSGLLARGSCTVVAYGKDRMEEFARGLRARFRHDTPIGAFVSKGSQRQRHPAWLDRSEEAVRRVDAAWRMAGAAFPIAEIGSCE